jgi:tetratricopeptide (TPR) repeat protein
MVLQLAVAAGATAAAYSSARVGGPGATDRANSITDAARSVNNLVYLTGLASLYAYTREQEAEADRLGFERAAAAGYDKTAGQRIWSEAIAERQASDFADVRKQQARASAFNTHPLDAERLATLQKLAGAPAASPDQAAEKRYRGIVRPHLGPWLKDDLRRRDYGQSLFLIDQLAELNEDMGVLQFYRGEAYRQRHAPGDDALAVKAYQSAVTHQDAPAEAWRELGDSLRRAGDNQAAVGAFETYLEKAPQADDRWLVEASLKSLKGNGGK